MVNAVKRTAACVGNREWPSGGHRTWELLARHLRPDRIGPKERRQLYQLLEASPIRRRMVELLKKRADVYRDASEKSERGIRERVVLLRGVQPELRDEPVDRLIGAAIEAIDVYERTSGLLQQAFDGLVWALKTHGGRARPETLINDTRLRRHLDRTVGGLSKIVPRVDRAMERLRAEPVVDPPQLVEPVLRLREDAVAASASVSALAEAVLRRHHRVQKDKEKAPWIERESQWTLMPGENRVPVDAPPAWHDTYLHPFKIPNAYSILRDLRQVAIEVRDAEE